MELVEMLKNLQANVEERLRQTDQYGGEIDELFCEIINKLEVPKTCEYCDYFGCWGGNPEDFTVHAKCSCKSMDFKIIPRFDFGCVYHEPKDTI